MAAKDQSFFEEQRDQSLVKAHIVSKYFDAWSKVMIGAKRSYGMIDKLAYIDLFCGPGRYTDGSKSTPVMVLEHTIKNPELAQMLVTMFNDKDKDNVSSLRESVNAISGLGSLKYPPQIHCSEVDKDAEEMFAKTKLCPTFSFVDPFGYKGLSSKFIHAMVKDWGCDCVFFFNYGRINAGISNPLVSKHMDALFGQERAEKMRGFVRTMNPRQREIYVLEELANALKDLGAKFVLPFRFKRGDGHRTSHALIFVTKDFRGYAIMKDIMARESSTLDEGVPSFAYSPAEADTPLLFSLSQPLSALKNELLKTYAGRSLTMVEVYESHNVDRPYIAKNYKSALNELEAKGQIVANKPAAKRQMRNGERTFADSTMVTFPPIRS